MTSETERIRHLLQIAIPLPYGLPYALRRFAMDFLRTETAIQYHLQNRLHQHLRVHCLPHAERLQADSRPEFGYIQGSISVGS